MCIAIKSENKNSSPTYSPDSGSQLIKQRKIFQRKKKTKKANQETKVKKTVVYTREYKAPPITSIGSDVTSQQSSIDSSREKLTPKTPL